MACDGMIESALGQFIRKENWRVHTLMVDTWSQLEPQCVEDAPKRTVVVPANRDPLVTVKLLVSAHEALRGSKLFEVDRVGDDIVVRQVTDRDGAPIDNAPWAHPVHLPGEETGAADALRAILSEAPGPASTSLRCLAGTPSCLDGVPPLNGVHVSYEGAEAVDFVVAVSTILQDTGDRYHWFAHVTHDGTWTLDVARKTR